MACFPFKLKMQDVCSESQKIRRKLRVNKAGERNRELFCWGRTRCVIARLGFPICAKLLCSEWLQARNSS